MNRAGISTSHSSSLESNAYSALISPADLAREDNATVPLIETARLEEILRGSAASQEEQVRLLQLSHLLLNSSLTSYNALKNAYQNGLDFLLRRSSFSQFVSSVKSLTQGLRESISSTLTGFGTQQWNQRGLQAQTLSAQRLQLLQSLANILEHSPHHASEVARLRSRINLAKECLETEQSLRGMIPFLAQTRWQLTGPFISMGSSLFGTLASSGISRLGFRSPLIGALIGGSANAFFQVAVNLLHTYGNGENIESRRAFAQTGDAISSGMACGALAVGLHALGDSYKISQRGIVPAAFFALFVFKADVTLEMLVNAVSPVSQAMGFAAEGLSEYWQIALLRGSLEEGLGDFHSHAVHGLNGDLAMLAMIRPTELNATQLATAAGLGAVGLIASRSKNLPPNSAEFSLSRLAGVMDAFVRARSMGIELKVKDSIWENILTGQGLERLEKILKRNHIEIHPQNIFTDIDQTSDVNRAVVELISNALDHSQKDIKVSVQNGSFSVTDTGVGMNARRIVETLLLSKMTEASSDDPRVGRFGIGFNTVYRHLNHEKDYAQLITSDGKTSYKIKFKRQKDASGKEDVIVRSEKISPRESGTQVKVNAQNVEAHTIQNKISEYCRYVKPQRAVVLNGQTINNYDLKQVNGIQNLSYQNQKVEIQKNTQINAGHCVLQGGDIIVEQYEGKGTCLAYELILNFPVELELSLTRDKAIANEALVNFFRNYIAQIHDVQTLNTLATLCANLDQRNKYDSILKMLKERLSKILRDKKRDGYKIKIYPNSLVASQYLTQDSTRLLIHPLLWQDKLWNLFPQPKEYISGKTIEENKESRTVHVILHDDLKVAFKYDEEHAVVLLNPSYYEKLPSYYWSTLFSIPNLRFRVVWNNFSEKKSSFNTTTANPEDQIAPNNIHPHLAAKLETSQRAESTSFLPLPSLPPPSTLSDLSNLGVCISNHFVRTPKQSEFAFEADGKLYFKHYKEQDVVDYYIDENENIYSPDDINALYNQKGKSEKYVKPIPRKYFKLMPECSEDQRKLFVPTFEGRILEVDLEDGHQYFGIQKQGYPETVISHKGRYYVFSIYSHLKRLSKIEDRESSERPDTRFFVIDAIENKVILKLQRGFEHQVIQLGDVIYFFEQEEIRQRRGKELFFGNLYDESGECVFKNISIERPKINSEEEEDADLDNKSIFHIYESGGNTYIPLKFLSEVLSSETCKQRLKELQSLGINPNRKLKAIKLLNEETWAILKAREDFEDILSWTNDEVCIAYLHQYPNENIDHYKRVYFLLLQYLFHYKQNHKKFFQRVTLVMQSNLDLRKLEIDHNLRRKNPDRELLDELFESQEEGDVITQGDLEIQNVFEQSHSLADVVSFLKLKKQTQLSEIQKKLPVFNNPKDKRDVNDAVNHLNITPYAFLREWLQNSVDAIRKQSASSTHLNPLLKERKNIEYRTFMHDGDFVTQARDYIGMTEEEAVLLLQPEKGTKDLEKFLGGFGVGFLSTLSGSKWIRLKTAVEGAEKATVLQLIPVYAANGKIVDVQVSITFEPRGNFIGTLIESARAVKSPLLEALRIKKEIKNLVFTLSKEEIEVTLNEKLMNEKSAEVEWTFKDEVLGEIDCYAAHSDEIRLAGQPLQELSPQVLDALPSAARALMLREGLGLNFKSSQLHKATKIRDRLRRQEEVDAHLKKVLPAHVLMIQLKRFLKGKNPHLLDRLPQVFFLQSESDHLERQYSGRLREDALKIKRGEFDQIDWTYYKEDQSGEERWTQLMTLIPIFQLRGDSLSLYELNLFIRKHLRQDQVENLKTELKLLYEQNQIPASIKERIAFAISTYETKMKLKAKREAEERELKNTSKTKEVSKKRPSTELFELAELGSEEEQAYANLIKSLAEQMFQQFSPHPVSMKWSTQDPTCMASTFLGTNCFYLFLEYNDWNKSLAKEWMEIKQMQEGKEKQNRLSGFLTEVYELLSHEMTHTLKQHPNVPGLKHGVNFYDDQMEIWRELAECIIIQTNAIIG